MIIILSPSKTQHLMKNQRLEAYFEKYIEVTKGEVTELPLGTKLPHPKLIKKLTSLSKSKLGQLLGLQGDLLEKTYLTYKNFENSMPNFAIAMYTGSVFREIKLNEYTYSMLTYMQKYVIILSALYGALHPFDLIRPYRLDMSHSVLKQNNLTIWSKLINLELPDSEIVINLASDEFSRLITRPMLNIVFKEKVGETFRVKSTYAKIARGLMTNYIIINELRDPEDIKNFSEAGYKFSKELSLEFDWVFIRS